MTDAPLGELERSRLAGEFKSLPRDERRRISRAGNRGVVLPTEAERNYQRALLGQMPRWVTTMLAILLPLQTINGWMHFADDHSALQLFGSTVGTLATPAIWWQWWVARRLRQRLDELVAGNDLRKHTAADSDA